MLDGKAKQFDDGLYAALDQAYYLGLRKTLESHVELVKRMHARLEPGSAATTFLSAGLELAGIKVPAADEAVRQELLTAFERNEVLSKPIGFYTWSRTLESTFRFLRFFQREFDVKELAVPQALAAALAKDPALRSDYRKAVDFYARLTNPYLCLTLIDLPTDHALDAAEFQQRCREKKSWHAAVALFPPSTSRETVLFEKLFPQGLPENTDLMHELVHRIRSGEVSLKPRPESGWYDYQVYALETLLLPEKGEEHDKLLLTRAYKKRMLEAFQALVTKRRETHSRFLGIAAKSTFGPPPERTEPRLRCEPCPSYYLRTARAYAFLANFLEAAVGKTALQELHGLKEGGSRPADLYTELRDMRELFYGLYLVSAEDIGLKPALARDEGIDPAQCYRMADDWLGKAFSDPDLAADTRVAVPIMVDYNRSATRLWLTLGVRLAHLQASYARAPSIKPAHGNEDWKPVETYRLGTADYLIPVDEFAELELPGLSVLTRKELRTICDTHRTREGILQALKER
jgi:hypothetical protein